MIKIMMIPDVRTYLEHPLHMFLGCMILDDRLAVPPHHLVDRGDDVQHLIFRDDAIFVDVVQIESPL